VSAHSRLAPSSAFRWVPCPLSVALGEQFPALTEHPSGPEGTAAHWVWLMMLTSHTPVLGELTPEGLPVTDEMLEGALQFVNKVFSIANPHQAMAKVRLEQRVSMSGIHPLMFGTPDGSIDLLEECGEWHMIDYKFGHRAVSPFENMQLAAYTFGEFERLGLTDVQIDNAKVFFHIVQPRCFHNRPANMTWETTGKDLRKLWERMRVSAREAIMHELSARPQVGAHCRDCPGRRACPTLRTNAGANIDWVNRSHPGEMPLDAAGLELKFVEAALAQLEAHASGLREQVEHGITSGGHCPDWTMQPTPGRGKHWTVPADEVIALGDMLEADLRKEPDVITPSQALALFKKKGFDLSVIDEYSAPNPGSVKLTARTDTIGSRVFGAIKHVG
jgi:hypothetical protein